MGTLTGVMAPVTVPMRGRRLCELAGLDHHVLTYDELTALGFNREEIRHRVATGRLHRKARGVFAVGSPHLSKHGRWMVAVKTYGPGAVLSFLSAALLWEIRRTEPSRIHVTVPRARNPRCDGIAVSRRDLPPGDVTTQSGIPVTTVVRTLVDLAAVVSVDELEQLVCQADAKNLLRVDTLRRRLDDRAGTRGVRVLCALVDRDSFTLSHSELERRFPPLALEAGLPRPIAQAQLGSARVDFYFADLGLVVECNSLRYHRTQFQQRVDAQRQHAHAVAGRLCLPFTHHQVARERGYVVRTLRDVARRLGQ